MSQLLTITWLKWKLLRNSMRSKKAVANQVASILGMLVALALALMVSLGLGFAAYAFTKPGLAEAFQRGATRDVPTPFSAELFLFSVLTFLYLMWATIPLTLGSTKQFDAGKLLMYPISLKKLFAIDFLSEITTLQSVFALPAILALCIGSGLGSGQLMLTLVAFLPVSLFGIALSKCLSTTVATLVRRRRARGEMIIAVVGAVAGFGGAIAGQVVPMVLRRVDSFRPPRWTPPGAAAFIIAGKVDEPLTYVLAFGILSVSSIALIVLTFWIARRSALGLGGKRQQKTIVDSTGKAAVYAGWQLPLLSSELSALVEKELRYAMRNAQLRMLTIMPLVLLFVRFINSQRFSGQLRPGTGSASKSFLEFSPGLMAAIAILYVFLVLAGLSCNQFAFEEGGMRTFILAPVHRKKILMGKNLSATVIAFCLCALLFLVNGVVFRDLTLLALLFAGLSFVVFASLMAVIGNWFSIRFPKRMQYGKRLNVSGVAGLLLIPMMIALAVPPLIATLVGWYSRSLLVEYATLSAFAVASLGFYFLTIGFQGRSLERRELDILEAVREPTDE